MAKGLHFEDVPEREGESGEERQRRWERERAPERTAEEEKWQMIERERGSNAQGLLPSPERGRLQICAPSLYIRSYILRGFSPPTNIVREAQKK